MKVIQIPTQGFVANCYLVYSTDAKAGFVVDPGNNIEDIVAEIDKNNIELKYIILTHGHGDHLSGVQSLKERYDIPLLIHNEDAEMIENADLNLSRMIYQRVIELKADRLLKDGDILEFGSERVVVIHTPGHTKGGISLYFDDKLITGDTLFEGSIGRTDLYGGNLKQLKESIKGKLFDLPNNTIVYPGHGDTTTIDLEKASNPYLR